jgi:hypothetical protein
MFVFCNSIDPEVFAAFLYMKEVEYEWWNKTEKTKPLKSWNAF